MKILYYSLLCAFFLTSAFYAFGQSNTFPPSGSVGIGTTNPQSALDIRHPDLHGNILRLLSSQGIPTPDNLERRWTIELGRLFDYPNRILEFGMVSTNFGTKPSFFVSAKGNELFRVTDQGLFGIGTSAPTHRLHVAGSGKWTGNASSYTEISSNSNGQFIRQYANDGSARSWIIRGYATNGVQAVFDSGGIDVNGTVKAREVNVTNTGWADHVFSSGYPLMDLGDLKRYVEEHGHLPGIPTEREVAEKGVNLGEINVKLLEKIEELTLYVIDQRSVVGDQNERIRELNRSLLDHRETVADQNRRIQEMESELQELKQLLKGAL